MTRPYGERSPHDRIASGAYSVRQLERRPANSNSYGPYDIKVFSDLQIVLTGDGRYIFPIDLDLDGAVLTTVEMFVSTVSSSGIVQVQLRNITQSVDMLSTRIQIDANEYHSATAATAYVISAANADVAHQDRIAIDVDAAGTNARGLTMSILFV